MSGPDWKLRRGATVTPVGTTFTVWAPIASSLMVHVATGDGAGDHPLVRVEGERGVWEAFVAKVTAGDRYGFRVDGADPLPDPVSRSQPEGVHALSEVIDPDAFEWNDEHWRGLALADFVIYEMHVGTFTPEGTFDAATARLSELRALGITAIEIMPLASFPGRRNWGYDGVHHYAPQESYGGVLAFKRFVSAAHAHGIGVVLDVVYNHVGPEGNYLDRFGPYFTDVYRTPWGRAVNYDGAGSDAVRRWAHDNALYWVSEFHVDALRLDAVHGIFDFGSLSFLEELSDEIHELGRQLGRKVQLMAESDLNDPKLVRSPESGGFGLDAQWSDDFHHTIHTTLTGESNGYYQDYCGIATMADVYRDAFFFARRYAPHRDRTHGRSAAGIPGQRFIVSAQNHDQIGNRPAGERLTSLVGPNRQRLAAALVLLSPYVPLLFMGEEYGETAPFLYFIEHGDAALVDAVRAGRKREFEELGAMAAQIDPQAEETFARCRLDWAKRESDAGTAMLSLFRDLLALRREEPALKPGASDIHVHGDASCFTALRALPLHDDIYDAVRSRRAILCAFNTSGQTMNVPVRADAVGAWTLRLSTDAIGYGGSGAVIEDIAPDVQRDNTADAPRRLIEPVVPLAAKGRSVRLPAWSAAVFTRDFMGGGGSL
ncbi:MAG: malto-oligosyltrehalose trehalohydrolase [bacterium]